LNFQAGTLWDSILRRTTHAIHCGALHTIPTKSEFISADGVDFLVRIVSNLARKDAAKKEQERSSDAVGDQPNPFLPYDEDLFVADVSGTHVAVLNKFNVVEQHLLIITRHFEDQETPLTVSDFEALWTCMGEYDGLAFYNSGETAGASQRHKHLQMVPLPLATAGPKVPIEPLLCIDNCSHTAGISPELPFIHAIAKIDSSWLVSPRQTARSTFELYNSMLELVRTASNTRFDPKSQSKAYNLLVTRQWMLLVPRVAECFASISINALGFAGALLVRNEWELQILKETGPLAAIKQVSVTDDRGGKIKR